MLCFDNIKIKEDHYQQLISLLKRTTKLNFEYYRRNFIERRIKARMIRVNCSNLNSYYDYINMNENEEIKKFTESFNINYSYFFRNWEVFDCFQNLFLRCLNQNKQLLLNNLRPDPTKIKIRSKKRSRPKTDIVKSKLKARSNDSQNLSLPSYLEKTSLYKKLNKHRSLQEPINIWSCPCASGEEPYSIAMILNNLKSQIPNFPNYKIVATDIDEKAISLAKIGIYNEESTKEISKYYENKFFKKFEDYFGYKYSINNGIKNNVEFINEDATLKHKKKLKYDIVFCRYLLIYFNRENRDKFLRTLENQLNQGGLLFLGKTETIFNSQTNFKLVDTKNHIYIKT